MGERQVAYMLERFYSPDALEEQIKTSGHHFIIGYSDDSPVAFASYSETEPGIFKLHKLYILPGQQGKGIGRYLAGYIAADIKSMGATTLRLNVNRFNHSAKSFYEKTGFKRYKEEDIDIGNGYFMNDHVLELAV